MKQLFARRPVVKQSLTLLSLAFALALLTSCSPRQEANGNAGANASGTSNSSNTAAQSAGGYIDLVGKWEGQSGGQPNTIFISSHKGETFTGTKTVGDTQIAIAGMVDLKTREITIRETNVDKGDKNYPLGSGTGTIAPNSRQMSGQWKAKGGTSPFSYSK
jgi:hypothetical protein